MTILQRAKNSNGLVSNSFYIFLIRFFPSLATLLVLILFSRKLTQDGYGEYQNFWVQLTLLSAIATIGIPAFVLTYSPELIKKVLSSLRAKHYVFFVVWITILASLFAYLRAYEMSMPLFIPLCFFIVYCFNAIAESLLIVYRKYTVLVLTNLSYAVIFYMLHFDYVSYYRCFYTTGTFFFYLLLIGLVRLVINSWSVIVHTKKLSDKSESVITMRDVRSLWVHIGIYDVFNRFITWIDKFVVSLLFTTGVSAVYFNATFDIPFLPLLLGAVGGAALMQMSALKKEDTIAGLIHVSNQTARLLSSVVFPLFFFLFIFRHELFTVLLTSKYAASVPIFAVTVFVVPLRAYNFTSILQNRHKGRIINTGALIDAVIAFGLMYPLYNQFDLLGIALSFVVSSYVQGIYYLYQSSKLLNVSILRLIPFRNWILKLIVFSIVFITAYYILSLYFNDSIVLLLGGIIMIIALLVTFFVEFRASSKKYGATVS